jgi:hydrogenase expression/formation protein HypD
MGYEEYLPIASKYEVPIVVTGFEPVDILQGIYRVILQLEKGSAEVENAYGRVVTRDGNQQAKTLLEEVFEKNDMKWRGIGPISDSGFRLAPRFKAYDAEMIFDVGHIVQQEPEVCIAGEVLQGLKKPGDCPAFARECKPEHPLGAPMVSSEGACAAYYRFNKTDIA